MIANNEIPPYKRLAQSVTDGRERLRSYAVLVEKRERLRSYTVLVGKSDRKRSKASLSLLECQRGSAPSARVTVNSGIKIVDRFCISQDSLRRSLSHSN
jgi:hypothetical protein